jgi:hypothetical protein
VKKIETIGVPVVLAVYNWPKESDRYRRVQRFIDYYFDRFQGFQKAPYHPDWRGVNLAANVPGWTRYPVAEEKLKAIAAKAQRSSPSIDARLVREQAARAAPNDASEQERLFREFFEWAKTQAKR